MSQSGYQIAKDDPKPAAHAPENIDVFALQNGRMLAPLREIGYALGGYVKQKDSGKETIILGTKTLMLTTGGNKGTIDVRNLRFM